jgi:hypothetical protein
MDMTAIDTTAATKIDMPTVCCPVCSTEFTPARSNQKNCSRDCQKNSSRAAKAALPVVNEVPRKKSWNFRRVDGLNNGRMASLRDAFHTTLPKYRAEFMVKLIDEGRRVQRLRACLTLAPLVQSYGREGGSGRLHIANLLNDFCKEVYGMRSYEVLDPATVLPSHEDLAFPALFYGPDEPAIYEDGSLNLRPCPWATRHDGPPKEAYQVSQKNREKKERGPVDYVLVFAPYTGKQKLPGEQMTAEERKDAAERVGIETALLHRPEVFSRF